MRRRGILGMAILFFFSSVPPSWAWGGGGWGLLAGLGLVAAVTGPWGPYGYPAYAYGPYNAYCYPGYYYPPYAYPRASPPPPIPYQSTAQPSPGMANPTAAQLAPEGGLRHDPQAMSDLLLELRTLLDVKVKDGDITKPQHDAEAAYLDRLAQESHSASLTEDDESGLVQKLHQAYYAISRNFVTD